MKKKLNSEDQKHLVRFLRDLIGIPSLPRQEKNVIDRIGEEMSKIGFDDVYVDSVGNIIGKIGDGNKKLLFESHVDTVGIGDIARWDYHPFIGKVEDGFIYGRGASDDKQGIASMVYGMKHLMQSDLELDGTIYVVGVVQEEDCNGGAMEHVCNHIHPDGIILGEATNLGINRGQRGRTEMMVTVKGKSAHAANPHQGINAVYHASKIISKIESLNDSFPVQDFLGKATVAVTRMIADPDSTNTIPDICQFTVDRRLVLGETEEKCLGELTKILQDEGVEGNVEILEYVALSYTGFKIQLKEFFSAWELPINHDLVKVASSGLEESFGKKPRIGKWSFSTDGVITMGKLGIPTIGFAPGDEQDAHSLNDKVNINDLYKAAVGYAHIAKSYYNKND
ncbi:MAG: peptidase [Anaerolineaceae bacterium]|nr:MAG: peptidase [Anaerolineaceae bacterium]